ncbi:hypothetical protein PRIPAC_95910 [Pristionchus pacificus]|uniref:Nuclear receptor n=1 Tax=Pristionchus pacificus TaxID=54126 RepID=A0A2A6D196_PRIPA|nr:hypothetical protein PRIPAC_95910 [Pristionchus pacificus]|eukprot:PDM84262.1 nuclear receptor [Pristionchus pacificus]
MSAKEKAFKCLICGAGIAHAHMGIDACRACGVFYRRSINLKYELICTCGETSSTSKGKIVSCRKCRFERFKDIYEKANSAGIACTRDEPTSSGQFEDVPNQTPGSSQQDDVQSIQTERHAGPLSDEPTLLYIDHNSNFKPISAGSETPLLDKMKSAYCTLCLVRKSGEMSTLHHHAMHSQIRNDEMALRPAKYSEVKPYTQIFFIGLADFAKSTFTEYNKMSPGDRHNIVRSNFRLTQSLDGSYRASVNFPTDDTVMATYTTYMNDESMQEFFDDCPPNVNKKEAIEKYRDNLKQTAIRAKSEFGKVKPTIDEFIALFGLALWNDYTASLSPAMTSIVSKIREAILKELKTVYIRKGVTEYAPRMGQLLCLLTNEEARVFGTRVVDLSAEHMHLYRIMNLFNESPDGYSN